MLTKKNYSFDKAIVFPLLFIQIVEFLFTRKCQEPHAQRFGFHSPLGQVLFQKSQIGN